MSPAGMGSEGGCARLGGGEITGRELSPKLARFGGRLP